MVRTKKNISSALLISVFAMLLPMVLATRVLNSNSYLIPLYAVGFLIQFSTMIFAFSSGKFVVSKNTLSLLCLYFIVLALPLLNDVLFSIPINYFDPINSLIKLANFVLFYVIIQNVSIDENHIARFMKVIVLVSMAACLFSLITEYHDILSIKTITNTNTLKIRSFFSNRNQYASFLVVAFVANVYLNQISKQRLCVITFALQIICILTTFSRSAFFCVIIIALLMLLQNKQAKNKTVIIVMVLIIACGIIFTTGIFDYILKNYVRWEASADSGRFTLWKYAWEIAKENLFTGVGFYTGADIAVSRGMGLTQFHSMFFDILVDGGICEVVFVVSVVFSVCKRCISRCPNRRLSAVYLSSLVAFVFHSCFESLSLFALSYADTLYTIFYISVPILLSNIEQKPSLPMEGE
jgi:hypothetical protein